MPFLKCHKNSLIDEKIRISQRNDWRCAIFSTNYFPKDRYKGQWKNDRKEGIGLEISRNNVIYQGEWLNGMKHGFGILNKIIEKNYSQKIYLGCWIEGKKQGFGMHWYLSSFYKGYFCKNRRHGFGQMWWNNGKYYEGEWKNNKFHGDGTLVLSDGNFYKGQFVNGKKQGNGRFYHKITGQVQNGIWNFDICVTSVMEDSAELRSLASNPTSYPIPQIN